MADYRARFKVILTFSMRTLKYIAAAGISQLNAVLLSYIILDLVRAISDGFK